MRDFLDQEIKVGDYVFYTTSYVGHKVGLVIKINSKTVRVAKLNNKSLQPMKKSTFSELNSYSIDLVKLTDEQAKMYLR